MKYIYNKLDGLDNKYLPTYQLPDFLNFFPSIKTSISSSNNPITLKKTGNGKIKIFMWSQMHGNETTTTKGLFDFLLFLNTENKHAIYLKNTCTFYFITQLNPDGANNNTRYNANYIDLNRDANTLSQLESQFLMYCFTFIKPDFCFNLHDQRTLFSITNYMPTNMAFLAPSTDIKRTITPVRKTAMQIISFIYQNLKSSVNIGRYDDTFNINCIGDKFMTLGVPTILFEAGFTDLDYNRNKIRYYIFQSIYLASHSIASNSYKKVTYSTYLKIPENEPVLFDILYSDVLKNGKIISIGVNYKEILIDKNLKFIPKIEKIGEDLSAYRGHKQINFNKKPIELLISRFNY